MELPISGLHRLFHTVPSSSHSIREKPSLESLTEERHTYDLLYPDYESLLHARDTVYPLSRPTSAASAATSYDDGSNLDIQSSRDIRVVVAQDGNAICQQPRVLYDSYPPPAPRPPLLARGSRGRGKSNVTIGDSGRIENGQIPAKTEETSQTTRVAESSSDAQCSPSPDNKQKSAFWGSQPPRPGPRSSVIDDDIAQDRLAREGREETDAFLGCMFGHTGMPLVSSTKLHINPPRSTSTQYGGVSSGSPDQAGVRLFPKRRTPLTRSMTAEDFQRVANGAAESASPQRLISSPLRGPSILVTRLFSMDVRDVILTKSMSETGDVQPDGEPLPLPPEYRGKQIKIPKYGVAILIQMPPTKRQNSMPTTSTRRSPLGSSFEEPHYLSAVREDPNGQTASTDNGDTTMIDQDIERIVAHWNVLTRAVSYLEAVARSAILTKLQDLIRHGVPLFSNLQVTLPSRIDLDGRPKKFKHGTERTIQLPGLALQDSVTVAKSARETCQRVASALKIRRVIAGQGRWGIWREEARWVDRWAGGKEQNFFLFNLLTAFLGNHTEWLDSLGRGVCGHRRPESTRRRPNVVKHRTVVVSTDKMAARRLIFLLSAFLPSSHVIPTAEAPPRPLSSRSSTGLSGSPPAGIPIPRERSLRRTINRKPRGNRTASPLHLHERSISFSTQDPSVDEVNDTTTGPGMLGHRRRTSDTRSIRSLALPIPTSYADMRKSSIATLSSMTQDCIAIPHFASPPKGVIGTTAAPRPGSSGSLASLSLRRTLSRSESNAESVSPESPSASRWGSMLSGFWSVRRRSSTDYTDPMGSPREGLGISGMQYSSSPGQLAMMVEDQDTRPDQLDNSNHLETLQEPPSPQTIIGETSPEATSARDIPERVKDEEYPMKLSIDNNDGVVDIDLPTVDSYSSSFDSSLSSPRITNTASSSFNDHGSIYGRTSHQSHTSLPADPPPAVDVAGYLKSYHQDFALQAVRPYKELKDEIKSSMQAEANTNPTSTNEVCTTLIADTSTFSITRLTLHHRSPPGSATIPKGGEIGTNSLEITEEPIMDLDPTLIAAVERAISDGKPTSAMHSHASSPSRPSDLYTSFESSMPNLEVSRSQCRTLVLGALEKVAKSVSAEQQQQQGRSIGRDEGSKKATVAEPDSTLREGVRRWLNEVGGLGGGGYG